MIRRIREAALAAFSLVLFLLWVRLLCRDRWIATEWILHIPLALMVLGGLVTAPLVRVRRPLAIALVLCFLLPIALMLHAEQPGLCRIGSPPPATGADSGALRLTAWNVMSYNGGKEDITTLLLHDDSDIICLLEGTYRRRPPDFVQKALGKKFHWAATRQMAIGSRFPIRESIEVPSPSGLRVFKALVEAPEGMLTVLLVDVPPPPRGNTTALYDDLWAIVQSTPEPFVLTGDFNTPRGSSQLRRATGVLDDFHQTAAPRAWLASWPAWLPTYQLDHSFASPGVEVLGARIENTPASDHGRQVLRFRLSGTAAVAVIP